MAEALAPQPTVLEVPPTSRSFKDVLGEMRGIGVEQKTANIKKTKEGVVDVRKWIEGAWGSIKDSAKKVGGAINGAEKVAIAMTTPRGREVLTGFLGDKVSENRQALKDKQGDISREFGRRKDSLVQGVGQRIDSLRINVSEHVLNPTIEKGRQIRNGVTNKAKEGSLFVRSIPRNIAEGINSTASSIQGKIESGASAVKRGYETVQGEVRKEFDSGVEHARDWGERFGEKVVSQAEAVQQGVIDRKNRILGKIEGWKNERKAVGLEKKAATLSVDIENARRILDGLPAMQLELISMREQIASLRDRGGTTLAAAEELRAAGGN